MESNSRILTHREKNYTVISLAKQLPRITKVEEKIIAAREVGLSFSQLDEEQSRADIDQLIFRCSAICGCALPNTEAFASILASEFFQFITGFGYENLTMEEVMLAMRLNAKGGLKLPSGIEVEEVVFTGKTFNVNYIAKVLSNYMAIRNMLDGKLRNHIDGY